MIFFYKHNILIVIKISTAVWYIYFFNLANQGFEKTKKKPFFLGGRNEVDPKIWGKFSVILDLPSKATINVKRISVKHNM